MTIPQAFQLALQHHQTGRLADAEALYRKILAAQPNHADALHHLGIIAQQAGRHDLAVEWIRKAIALDPGNPVAYSNFGVACRVTGRLDEAIAAYRRALDLKPDYPEALINLGSALSDQGRLEEAMAAYRRALELKPDYPEAHNNLGNALMERGQLDEAIAAYRRALEFRFNYPDAYNNLGNALREQDHLAEAIAACLHALELKPDLPEAHNNLGNAFRARGQLDEAGAAFHRALELKPAFPEALNNLGNALKDQGELDEAIAAYRGALQIKPDYVRAHSNLVFTLHFHPGHDAAEISDEHRRWNLQFSDPVKRFVQPHANDPAVARRLRIGYVSPDFRDHAVGRYVLPLFEHHDREQFEIICYSECARPDGITERLRALSGKWRSTVGISDHRLAEMIREDGVDILVDLGMHTGGNRLPVFARQPAPVQVAWLAYPGSTGLPAIGYRLTDSHMEPVGSRSRGTPWSAEEPVRLPDCWCCYLPEGEYPEVNALPALSAKGVTFGSLNNFAKVNDSVLQRWARVLQAAEGSRIIMPCPMGRSRDRVRAFFGARGIAAERVELVSFLSRWEYLSLYRRIDIGLDPFPCNGMTTTCDALWMGVPVLTLPGVLPASRAGLSLLSSIGLGELVADSENGYLRMVEELAGNLPHLADLRATLRARMLASPLMDAPRFAQNVEAAYQSMWRAWCAGRPPIHQAIALNPADIHHYIHLGNVLASQGRFVEAIDAYRRALRIDPACADACYNLGTALQNQGHLDEAIAAYREALQCKPDFALAHNNLGAALKAKDQLDEAIASYRTALRIDPAYAKAHNNLGVALREKSQLAEAEAACRCAVRIDPNYADAWYNLGNASQDRGHLDDALDAYHRALELKPGFPEAYNNLGNALRERRQFDEAMAAYRRALELKPGYPEAEVNLGSALARQGHFDEAIAMYRHVLELHPDLPEAHNNLGNTLRDMGELDEAIAAYRLALRLKPDEASTHSNLIFTLHSHPAYGREAIDEEHQRWKRRFADPLQQFVPPHANNRNPERRLRVGYVSPDFRDHPVGRYLFPLFERHDREQFEILCYSGVAQPDWLTERLRALSGGWRSAVGASDTQLAEMIREDGVDILVDLALHTANNRLPVFARQPAPVQVTWLGYPASTGVPGIGYRLTDARMDPPGDGPACTAEEPVCLPDCWCCYDPIGDSPEINALPALSAGGVTFGSLNKFAKVHEGVLALWARVLTAVEGSRLLMLCPEGRTRERVLAFFRERGIAVARVEFTGQLPRWDYLSLYQRIDIALDPFPCNGITTTCDALWMGAPVLTLPGETPISRAGLGILSSVGLEEVAASSEKDYVRLAAELAGNLPRLASFRATLRSRMLSSPLMHAPRFARDIETAYRKMWQRWCREKTPTHKE